MLISVMKIITMSDPRQPAGQPRTFEQEVRTRPADFDENLRFRREAILVLFKKSEPLSLKIRSCLAFQRFTMLGSRSNDRRSFDASSGKPHYQLQRLEGLPEVFASPVGAGGRVYIAGRDGVTLVLRNGKTYDVLASNKLDDGFDASPVPVEDAIYLRGYRYLYCIAAQ